MPSTGQAGHRHQALRQSAFLGVILISVSLLGQTPLAAQAAEAPSSDMPSPAPAGAAWTADQAEQAIRSKLDEAKSSLRQVVHGDFMPMLSVYFVPALISLLLISAGYIAAGFVGRFVSRMVSSKLDVTLGRFLGKFVANAMLVMLFVSILRRFGIETAHFAAVIAAMGFAIGMALQGALSNFAAGVMLLVFRPFRVGDIVRISDCEGTVDEIELFTTRLNTFDNRHLILPNGQVFGSVIHNYTHNPVRRVDVNVGVAYDADIRQTRNTLENAVSVIPGAVSDPPPKVVLTELGDSAVQWQVRIWTRTENFLDVRERVITAVKDGLEAARISIPFPQVDVHLFGEESSRQAFKMMAA